MTYFLIFVLTSIPIFSIDFLIEGVLLGKAPGFVAFACLIQAVGGAICMIVLLIYKYLEEF